MKITNTLKDVDSSSPTYAKKFGIKNPGLVLSILRDKLYSNKHRVIAQEYLCNARDAHREIKQTRKIEVTIPTVLDSNLRIRDFGPGLSRERFDEVFVYFGESTKRDSNNETGGFGIGAKSAWSYTDTFIVTSFHNGIKYGYSLVLDKTNCGEAVCLFETETDEPNGVEVCIPINKGDVKSFTSWVVQTVAWWAESEKPTIKNLLKEDYNSFIVPVWSLASLKKAYYPHQPQIGVVFSSENASTIRAVVDGICYTIEFASIDTEKLCQQMTGGTHYQDRNVFYSFLKSTILVFGTGEVDISANRETLDFSEKTKRAISKKFMELKKVFAEFSSKEHDFDSIHKLVDYERSIATIRQLCNNKLDQSKSTYKSKPLNEWMKVFSVELPHRKIAKNGYARGTYEDCNLINDFVDKVSQFQTLLTYNFAFVDSPSYPQTKIKSYQQSNDENHKLCLCAISTSEYKKEAGAIRQFIETELGKDRIIDLDQFKIKKTRAPRVKLGPDDKWFFVWQVNRFVACEIREETEIHNAIVFVATKGVVKVSIGDTEHDLGISPRGKSCVLSSQDASIINHITKTYPTKWIVLTTKTTHDYLKGQINLPSCQEGRSVKIEQVSVDRDLYITLTGFVEKYCRTNLDAYSIDDMITLLFMCRKETVDYATKKEVLSLIKTYEELEQWFGYFIHPALLRVETNKEAWENLGKIRETCSRRVDELKPKLPLKNCSSSLMFTSVQENLEPVVRFMFPV